jgi:serine/threonine protein kinase
MIHSQETVGWQGPGEPRPPDWPAVPGYEVLGELGRGGMGVVYRARHAPSGRLVALKLIRDGVLAGPQDRARFRLEAEAAARIEHPNVVAIHEVGEHASLPFFSMELIEGGALDRRLAGQPQEARAAAVLVRTLAAAIEHAHAQKIIHRDLKPANILLASGGVVSGGVVSDDSLDPLTTHHSPFTPKITDFGLAKRLDGESTAWTQAGAVLGTASYMAPEQAEGRIGAIGPACDIYSLGAILYELLTGRPPFVADSWNQTVWQVLHDEPTPPSRVVPGVPVELEAICLACLEKEPSRRYPTARALAEDLSRFLAAQPVQVRVRGETERLARLAERDGFRLEGEIGRGPRSVVYLAVYEPLKQTVAVKVFTAGLMTRDAWEARLAEGAALWPALTHPQISAIHRAGWWDGAGYVVTDLAPQGSLATRLGSSRQGTGRQGTDEALELVVQLTDLVSYLHRQGIVHGNLKPANVLLAADGIPRLADFQLTGGLFVGQPPQTEVDSHAVGYVAPELLAGSTSEPRPYTDIYGLGLILYELLAGRPPFDAEAGDIRQQVASHDPAPPSTYSRDVSTPLDAVTLRCLRKNPWRRYYRVYDLLSRLRYLRDNPHGELAAGQWWTRGRPASRAGRAGT